jgi:EmrB/QacA subfamily drug resistance transporter
MSLQTGEEYALANVSEASPAVSSRWLGLIVVLVATFMAMLDGFIVNVAIPSIQHSMQANPSELELISAAYSLPYALLVITGGRLGDLYGVRRLFMIGMALFTAFSVLCAAAPNPILLLAARVGQACGGALMYPQVLSFIQLSFHGQERAQALSLWAVAGGLASVFGQLIGGSLITANIAGLTWRSIFLVNLPLGIVVLLGAWAFVHERRAPRKVRLDLWGTVLVACGLLLLLYPIVTGRSAGWPWWMLLCLPLALVVLVGFGWFEYREARRGAAPLMNLALFRLPSFLWGCVMALVGFASTAAFFFVLALYLQNGLGFSALLSGLAFLPLGVTFIVSSGLSSRVATRLGHRAFALAFGLAAVGTFGLLLVANAAGKTTPAWGPLLLTLVTIGIGLGLGAPAIMTLTLRDIPEQEAGVASGILETMIQLGFALSAPLIGLVFFNVPGPGAEIARGYDIVHAFTQSLLAIGGSLILLVMLVPFLQWLVGKNAVGEDKQ